MTENNDATLDKLDNPSILVTVFGVVIGTATAWDEIDHLSLIFLNFKPNLLGYHWLCVDPKHLDKPYPENKTLFINFETGDMQYTWDENNFIKLTPNWSVFT